MRHKRDIRVYIRGTSYSGAPRVRGTLIEKRPVTKPKQAPLLQLHNALIRSGQHIASSMGGEIHADLTALSPFSTANHFFGQITYEAYVSNYRTLGALLRGGALVTHPYEYLANLSVKKNYPYTWLLLLHGDYMTGCAPAERCCLIIRQGRESEATEVVFCL